MDGALAEACLEKIQKASKPMSLAEIRSACVGRSKANGRLVEALKELVDRAIIHEWPSYRRSQIFGSQPLRSAVEEAFVTALDEAPLTIPKAAKPVSRSLGRVSEESVLAELRVVAPKMAAARKIIQVPINRQSVVYMSLDYLRRLVPGKSAAEAMEQWIIATLKELQSGPGNFVGIDELRRSRQLRRFVDSAIISLADKRKLILGHYGGPRPTNDEEKSSYLEDLKGQLVIAVALPRSE
ncbi:MAG: hypothetical protein ACLP7P_08105 [Rhodomicrobium sp.]